jgi:hypothetical protein
MKFKNIVLISSLAMLCLTGCVKCSIQSADKSFIIKHTTYGLAMEIKLSDVGGNQLPSISGGLGGTETDVIPEYASTNDLHVNTAVYTSGQNASQQGSTSALTQSGGNWTTAGHVSLFKDTNVLVSPSTNYPTPQNK